MCLENGKDEITPRFVRLPDSVHVGFRFGHRHAFVNNAIEKAERRSAEIHLTVQQRLLVR
jgi:hypothetical protein